MKYYVLLQPAPGVEIEIVSSFPREVNSFWERFRQLYPAMLVRDQDYLNWRYAQAPRRHYHICLAWSEKKIVGIGVASIHHRREDAERLGLILELAALPPHKSLDSLLKSMLLWLVQNSADGVISRLAPSDPVQSTFKRFGFQLRPERFGQKFAYRIIEPGETGEELLLNPASWHTSLGDSDDL
jgi:hypothetical protein